MTTLLRYLAVASVAVTVAAAAVHKLPKDFKKCRKHDPQLNACLKDAIQSAMASLERGVPSLGVLTIDPLRISQLLIDQGTGPVSVKLDFIDLDMHGLKSIRVDKVNADWDRYYLETESTIVAPLRLEGSYKVNGKVLVLPIQGAGANNLTLENVKAKFIMLGKPLKKNGEDYMDVEKVKLKVSTTRLHIYLENLFNGDKALGDNMNVFLNENWQEILKELLPAMEEGLGETFRTIANRIFHKVPLSQIFLD